MFERIESIKSFGIFKDFSHSGDLCDFLNYNLVYGWNGSGKTTLSKLFRSMETGVLPEGYGEPLFKIKSQNSQVTQTTLTAHASRLFVFNQDFVAENIDWSRTVKSVLLVSKEKIDERKQLESLKSLRDKLALESEENTKKITALNDSIEAFCTTSARNIKQKMQVIDTSDTYYLNYNKAKLRQSIEANIDFSNLLVNVLSDEDTKKVTEAIRPDAKPQISVSLPVIDEASISGAIEAGFALIAESVIAKTIQRLKDFPDVNNWVETGLNLTKKLQSTTCEFCGQAIPSSRLKELEEHFSDHLVKFKASLVDAKQSLQLLLIDQNKIPDPEIFYPEYKSEFNIARANIIKGIGVLNKEIAEVLKGLEQRVSDPFKTISLSSKLDKAVFVNIKDELKKIVALVSQHNAKTANFEEELKKLKKKLELHYTSQDMLEFKFVEKKTESNSLSVSTAELAKKIKATTEQITAIENSLSNESLGAVHFNHRLHKFLGHKEISLVFDPLEKGYKIQRLQAGQHAKNLSEGEKTAVAFIYFMTKLREKDNKISDSIIVIDDPVSSFDSNNIFSAYAFLKSEFAEAKQLFVFTHSFVFFKLVRDWLKGKNKKGKNGEPDKIKSCFYAIEITPGDERKARLANALASLIDYDSEYHYLFQKLYSFREKIQLDLNEAFLVGNIARKLLEAFFAFKFPRRRGNFSQWMEAGVADVEKRERVYRFINKYSHNQTIEAGDSSIDNLLGESTNIVGEILSILENLDANHYTELVEIASS